MQKGGAISMRKKLFIPVLLATLLLCGININFAEAMNITGSFNRTLYPVSGKNSCLSGVKFNVSSNSKTTGPSSGSQSGSGYFKPATAYRGTVNDGWESLGYHSSNRTVSSTGYLGSYDQQINSSAMYNITWGSGVGSCTNKGTCPDNGTWEHRGYNLSAYQVDNSGPSGCTAKTDKSCYGRNEIVTATFTPRDVGCAGADKFERTFNASSKKGVSGSLMDKAGNLSGNHCYATWNYDATGPTFSAYAKGKGTSANGYYKSFTVGASNAKDSGCAGLNYCTSTTASKNGTYNVYCYDKANNSSSRSIYVGKIDNTGPKCTVNSYGTSNYIKKGQKAHIVYNCSDTQAGCASSTVSVDLKNGERYQMSDRLGNTTSCPAASFKEDGTAPSITITTTPAGTSALKQTNGDVQVKITATDSQSGVKQVCYSLSGATSQGKTCVAGSTATFTVKNDGKTTISAEAYDKALVWNGSQYVDTNGNVSKQSKDVYIDDDDQPKVVSVTANGGTSNYVSSAVASYKVSDGLSGIGTIELYWGRETDSASVCSNLNSNGQPNGNLTGDVVNKITVSAGNMSYSGTSTAPNNNADLNGAVYLHVRVCDRATSTTDSDVLNPNCTTGRLPNPIYFDNQPPETPDNTGNNENIGDNDAVIDDTEPVTPPTDLDNPNNEGDGGSEYSNQIIVGNKTSAFNWTNRLRLGFNFSDSNTTRPGAYSGIAKAEFYYDDNMNHDVANKNTSNYPTTADNEVVCKNESAMVGAKTCSYYLDFNKLQSYNANTNSYTSNPETMEEGHRYIKVKVIDRAGNYSIGTFGDYQFDISPNEITDINFSEVRPGTMVEN